jgi:RND family efflux transporter MFP subunit
MDSRERVRSGPRRRPTRPGMAFRRAGLAAAVPLAALVAASCSQAEPAQKAAPPTVEVAPVIRQDVDLTREWVGTLDGSVNAEIRPQVEGYLLRRVYHEGSYVRKGTLLFEIDPRQFQAALDQANGDLARNQAALVKARIDVERFTPLAAEKAISQEELDNAQAALRQAEADVGSATAAVERARLNLGWTRVVSPIDGIAGSAKAQVGDLVSGATLMTTVSTVDPIRAYFNPSEQEYMSWLQHLAPVARPGVAAPGGGKGLFRLILADGSLYPERGDLAFTDRSVDVRTGTIPVAAVFPNPSHALRPGQYARIRAVTGVRKGALLVPQRAVSELQGTYHVVVVGPDDKAEIRPVQTAERIGRLWVIAKGLDPGDRVVVEGLQKARPGSLVNPVPVPPEEAGAAARGATPPASAGAGS